MISLDQLLRFLAASVVVTLAPGPDIIYVLTRGMTEGRRIALAAAAGFALGNVVHTALAAAGLSALVLAMPRALRVIQYAGAAYLVYLGVMIWRDRSRFELPPENAANSSGVVRDEAAATARRRRAGEVFRQSMLANVLNPKVAFFFLAFLQKFVDPERGSVPLQFAVLGAIFILQVLVCFGAVAWAAGWLGDKFLRHPSLRTGLRVAAGGVLAALGVLLALSEPMQVADPPVNENSSRGVVVARGEAARLR
jgi:threonine/homoserine/homoserine lactone efflux protein